MPRRGRRVRGANASAKQTTTAKHSPSRFKASTRTRKAATAAAEKKSTRSRHKGRSVQFRLIFQAVDTVLLDFRLLRTRIDCTKSKSSMDLERDYVLTQSSFKLVCSSVGAPFSEDHASGFDHRGKRCSTLRVAAHPRLFKKSSNTNIHTPYRGS